MDRIQLNRLKKTAITGWHGSPAMFGNFVDRRIGTNLRDLRHGWGTYLCLARAPAYGYAAIGTAVGGILYEVLVLPGVYAAWAGPIGQDADVFRAFRFSIRNASPPPPRRRPHPVGAPRVVMLDQKTTVAAAYAHLSSLVDGDRQASAALARNGLAGFAYEGSNERDGLGTQCVVAFRGSSLQIVGGEDHRKQSRSGGPSREYYDAIAAWERADPAACWWNRRVEEQRTA